MSVIAIIPARGGSKRIPRKNVRDFLGKPIIAYSIEVALSSGSFDEVMVSTDDEEIAEVSKKYGARVPFLRSKEHSGDMAMTAPVLLEVLSQYREIGVAFMQGCCIYPCAPFINSNKLQEGLELLKTTGADTAVPVTRFSYPIQRALRIANKKLVMADKEYMNVRSQDLEPMYHDIGQYYWFVVNSFVKEQCLFSSNTAPIITPECEVQDIDTEEDWKMAEMKYKIMQGL